MTKLAVKKKDEVVKPSTQLQAFDMGSLKADAGSGSQNISAEDMQTPIISILQANSPQCKKSDGKYIKGASEGMLYNNVTNEVYSGEEGLTILPAFYEKVYIEWKPNRGGLVAIHPATTPLKDQVKMVVTAEGKESPTLPNGNQLIETNQHYVLVLKDDGTFEPAVLALSSSALKASRQLNTLIKRVSLVDDSGSPFNPASYIMRYKLSTTAKTNDQYSWFGWNISSIGGIVQTGVKGNEAFDASAIHKPYFYMAAKSLEQAVNAGSVKVKQEQVDTVGGGVSPEDDIIY